MRNLSVARVRAAWWTLRVCRAANGLTAKGDLAGLTLRQPPELADRERSTVLAILARRQSSCLVRSLVLQAWDAAHGRPRDLIIGVTAPSEEFRAHAWLEGDRVDRSLYSELTRRGPTSATASGHNGGGRRGSGLP